MSFYIFAIYVIWRESIPAEAIWGQPYINAIEESLKLERFSNLNTQTRQGPLKLPARAVLLPNCITATCLLLLTCSAHRSYQGQHWTQAIAQHTQVANWLHSWLSLLCSILKNPIFAADVSYLSKRRAQGQGRDALGVSHQPIAVGATTSGRAARLPLGFRPPIPFHRFLLQSWASHFCSLCWQVLLKITL